MHLEKIGERYIYRCTYHEHGIPKSAGFRWDQADRVWFTVKPEIAAKLASPEDRARIVQDIKAKQALRADNMESSRHSDAVVDVPRPAGLEYLPYQRAGIVTAAKRLGIDVSMLPGITGEKGGVQSISSAGVLFGDEMG